MGLRTSLRSGQPYRIVELALGLVLAATAALKVSGLGSGTLAGDGWYARADVQAAAMAWEGLLAAGLFWGGARRLVWLLCVVTFVAFSGVNLSMGLAGQATCNCFGAVAVNPWWVLSLDVVVLATLMVSRPPLTGFRRPGQMLAEVRPLLGIAATTAALAGGLVLIGWMVYGSPSAAAARLRGEVGGVRGRLVELGDHPGRALVTPAVEVIT